MIYLEAINEVLVRLREPAVSTINQNSYSSLISHLVNDAKRQVEDAWDWDVQNTTLVLTTISGTSTYTLVGSGVRQKGISANITTLGSQSTLYPVSLKWIQNQQQLTTTTNAQPSYYAWTGNNGTDSKVELFDTPDAAYTIKFNLNVPQLALTDATDIIQVPSDAVVMGAYARALAERGEDGALASSEAYGLFKGIMADRIALEQSRSQDYDVWVAT
jgi:hypothetical protein